MVTVNRDEEHLRLLSIGYYVFGGIQALLLLVPFVFSLLAASPAFMQGMVCYGMPGHCSTIGPPAGWLLFMVFYLLLVLAVMYVGLYFLMGYWLSVHRHYMACLVLGALACLAFPLGTLLGILTLAVLFRPSVRDIFEAGHAPPAHPA